VRSIKNFVFLLKFNYNRNGIGILKIFPPLNSLSYSFYFKQQPEEKEGFFRLVWSKKYQTQKTAFYILITYILCFQFSAFLLYIPAIRSFFLNFITSEGDVASITLIAWWTAVAGLISVIISVILISRDKNFWNVFKGEKAPLPVAIGWGILGFFLVLFGQSIGAQIEFALGVDYKSENTEAIMNVTKIAPIMILASVISGPILEELIFRRVIFGSIIQTQNFLVAALVSSIMFGVIHLDFSHIILYTITGFIFAYLYYRTKRLLTSIIAHMLFNGFVTLYQLNYEKIKQML